MHVDGQLYRTIWLDPADPGRVRIIDQRHLPHAFVLEDLRTVEDVAVAIRDMHVRGAGLIGATAGYGMHLAARSAAAAGWNRECFLAALREAGDLLCRTRPTAVNLAWAVARQMAELRQIAEGSQMADRAREVADEIADEDAAACRRIGEHGVGLIEEIAAGKPSGQPVNVLTHCNAGWLAFVDHGSATAPVYEAFRRGLAVHVWVDETRPRNQGASLTAWELGQEGIPHTVIVDNAGGHLMQHGLVDLVIVGSDRVTRTGDVANKIGTYLKALAARDNGVPFFVAFPSSTIDWSMRDGVAQIPIEERDPTEVSHVTGRLPDGRVGSVRILPDGTRARNFGFDVTPARLVTGFITERGLCPASEAGLGQLFTEKTGTLAGG